MAHHPPDNLPPDKARSGSGGAQPASACPQSLLGLPNKERSVSSDPASCFLSAKFGRRLAPDKLNPKKEKKALVTKSKDSLLMNRHCQNLSCEKDLERNM